MKELRKKIQKQFDIMCQTGMLFRVEVTGRQVWDAYQASFTKVVFRDPASSVYNCNNCNNFIRRYGNIVAIVNGKIVSIFNVDGGEEYGNAMTALSKLITKSKISDVFIETFDELTKPPYEKCSRTAKVFKLGIATNFKNYSQEEVDKFGVVTTTKEYEFNHFALEIPEALIDKSGKSVESLMAIHRDNKNVFERGLKEISLDTLELVRDLINQGSLLDGTTHLHKVEKFIKFKKEYDAASEKDNWLWVNSHGLPIAKFRNELIGTLCVELTEGEDLNKACQTWNKRVDPANYMKTTAPITERQKQETKKFVQENGFEESFDRRCATIEDIKVSEILHVNAEGDIIKTVSIFDSIKTPSTRHKRSEFDGIEEVGIDKFMKDILPGCTSLEVYLENQQEGNLVTLTTAKNPDSKPIMKWPNNYSYTFKNNLAGKSQIKEAVKLAGGNIDGVLNCRLAWNCENEGDNSDLDLWCQEPGSSQIGYSTGYRKDRGNTRSPMSGQLDVDNTGPGAKMGVENITWTERSKMRNGVYRLWVNQFANRGSRGFRAEIEFDGEIYCYEYKTPVRGNIDIAEITMKDGVMSITHKLPVTAGSNTKEIYGLETNKFHKVNLMCLSPNHWAEPIGNKYYLFFLEGCKADTKIRSFHNENLIGALLEHKKVLEVLGSQCLIESTDKQLSGLGFNATVRDEVVVKLGGSHKRVVKVKFGV